MPSVSKGLIRLAVVAGASVTVGSGLAVYGEAVSRALGWIELLAPKPGLSGLALLLLSPAAFLLLLTMVDWILDGFGLGLRSRGPE